MTAPSAKKLGNLPTFELVYWPGIPGRGELIRLALEAAGASYTDEANEKPDGVKSVLALIDPKSQTDDAGNPPIFAPPAVRVPGAGSDGKPLLLFQTSCILSYLGPKLGLVPEDEGGQAHVLALTLTSMDLLSEIHDTHHPIAASKYYEDQKDEALKKAEDFRGARLPKFLGYFERVLKGNKASKGTYLVGDKLTYADTTLWQAIDGLHFSFPKELAAIKGDYPLVFDTFYPGIKAESGIKEYLASGRRKPYSMGLFREYPELDRQ